MSAVLYSCKHYMMFFGQKTSVTSGLFVQYFSFEKEGGNCEVVAVCKFKKKKSAKKKVESRRNEKGNRYEWTGFAVRCKYFKGDSMESLSKATCH